MEDRASLLIVDDERGPAESLRMIFKPDYEVRTASGGQEALDVLRSTPIDVVTLDLRMPGMPGTEVMEHIKRIDPDIEIIVVTGYASLDSALRGLRHRVFDYVTKPFDVPQISELVRRAVARRRSTLRGRRMKDDFLGNLSHELRTPLSAIIGYNSILVEELQCQLSVEQRSAFDRVQANSQQLLNLIETVLLLNSLDAGELERKVSTFDARDTLRRAVLHFSAAARQAGLDLTIEGDCDALWVHTDEHKFERILWALVDNAVKFTTQGSIGLTARATDGGTFFETTVRDSGTGIAGADIARLVEGTTAPAGVPRQQQQGLGLGLRMASRLTAFLGGQLEVNAGEDGGTRFTIALPAYYVEAEQNRRQNA
jgi:signal transduction histidine kinase